MLFKADFHIHSCLSPCGSLEMSPVDIVSTAKAKGLNLIAISDHNSAMNCPALHELCANDPDISCFYGMEITSEEEVHILSLFDNLEAVIAMSSLVYKSLPEIINDPDKFGDQVAVDAENNIIGEAEIYLGSPTSFSVSRVVELVHSHGGLVIPAHVDRPVYSLSSQLGFIPEEDFDALELSKHYVLRQKDGIRQKALLNLENYPLITNSDSHYLADIGAVYNSFETDELSVNSLKKILFSYKNSICMA